MRLIYLTNVGLPTEWAHGVQIMKMGEAFVGLGIDIEMIIPRRRNEIKADPFVYYNVKQRFNITKLPCLDFVPGSSSSFAFWLRNYSFLFLAKIYLLFKKYDVLYTREQSAGLFFKNFILEIHFLPSQIKKWHKKIWQKAKKIIVLTSFIKNELIRSGIEGKNILIAADGVDLREFDIDITREGARQQLSLPQNKKIVMYAGSFYLHRWKGLDVLLEASRFFADGILVVLVGGEAEEIKKIQTEFGQNNILLAGRQPYNRIPYYLKAADVLVLPNKKGDENSEKYTSPLKLFEYMAAGRPIVASNLPSIKEVLNEDNAFLVEAGNSQALAGAIIKLLDDKVLNDKIAEKSFEDVKGYTWQKRAQKILDFISDVKRRDL